MNRAHHVESEPILVIFVWSWEKIGKGCPEYQVHIGFFQFQNKQKNNVKHCVMNLEDIFATILMINLEMYWLKGYPL